MNTRINFKSYSKMKMQIYPQRIQRVQLLRNLFCSLVFKIYLIQIANIKGGIIFKDIIFLVKPNAPQGYRKYGAVTISFTHGKTHVFGVYHHMMKSVISSRNINRGINSYYHHSLSLFW